MISKLKRLVTIAKSQTEHMAVGQIELQKIETHTKTST
jgi:hypothetical protein